ncbi:MAG: cysteine desulfurase family protein [Planctomycetota bacterium]
MALGVAAEGALEQALARLGAALGLGPEQRLTLTAGGTAANALAIACAVGARPGRHLIAQPTEHPSVLRPLRALEEAGYELTWLGVDPDGRVDPEELAAALRPDTALCSLMAANHETGALQPLAAVAARCRAAGVLLHSDAVQALGRLPLAALPADLLTFSAHKLGGPRGLGGLISGPLAPACTGHGPGARRVAALAAALEAGLPDPEQVRASRDALEAELLARVAGARRNGPPVARLPGHLSLSFPGVSGEALALELDLAGIAASSGAACASGEARPSHVLVAMGRSAREASESLRLSLGRPLDAAERARVVASVERAVARLRGLAGAGS